MGTDVTVTEDKQPCKYSFKVHGSMCSKLMKLVTAIEILFPEIEAARPRCLSGIQVLCALHSSMAKANQLLQHCCDSSKLYLAITGDAIVSRCQRSRNLLEQSLDQVQTMVPVMLAAKISKIIDDLRETMFTLDSSENEAGKAMRNLLQKGASESDLLEHLETKAIQLAASRLHITTPKAILIEKRSIKRLLDKVGDDCNKKMILTYLLYILKTYGNTIITEDLIAHHEGSFPVVNLSNGSANNQAAEVGSNNGHTKDGDQTNLLNRGTPPEEFRCPISMRLMYDPVVIASGQTFERVWIQKWFDEGNHTCPKTKLMLPHRSLTPNATMKDLISRWCSEFGVTLVDPTLQSYQSVEMSSISIASLGSSMNDLRLPVDISSVSLGSLDTSYSSDTSHTKFPEVPRLSVMNEDHDSRQYLSGISSDDMDLDVLCGVAELQWDSQCKVVEDINCRMQSDSNFRSFSCEKFIQPLLQFLTDAKSQNHVGSLRAGSQLLLALVSKNRSNISCLHEETFGILESFLDSEVKEEVLAIFEVLSRHQNCKSKITASGSLVSILKILDLGSKKLQEMVVRTLLNLSSNSDSCSRIVILGGISKLLCFMNDADLSKHCIVLLENLCGIEEARIAVAETNGCIASISELLESGSQEEQEHAVAILLSLCSQRVQYCQLVMDEGVIPSLVYVTKNGNDRGKAISFELLRQLRDIKYEKEQEYKGIDDEANIDAMSHPKEKKPSSKKSGFLRKMIFKPTSVASKNKR